MDILAVLFDPKTAYVARDGSRIVTINGKEKKLNDLAGKLFKTSRTDVVDSLTVGQRLEGIRVARLMKDAYLTTDQKIHDANIFFKAFVRIREGFSTLFLPNVRAEIVNERVISGLLSYELGGGRGYIREDDLECLDPKLRIEDNFKQIEVESHWA